MALNTPVKANYFGWFSEPIQNAFWLALIDKEQREVPGVEVAKVTHWHVRDGDGRPLTRQEAFALLEVLKERGELNGGSIYACELDCERKTIL